MDKLYSLLLYSSDSRNFFLRLPLDLDEGILSSCVGYNLVYLGRPRLRDPYLLDPASEFMMRACAVKLRAPPFCCEEIPRDRARPAMTTAVRVLTLLAFSVTFGVASRAADNSAGLKCGSIGDLSTLKDKGSPNLMLTYVKGHSERTFELFLDFLIPCSPSLICIKVTQPILPYLLLDEPP